MARGEDGSVLERLRAKRVCICVGAGGVGKTTISAALALGVAARGARVAVVTIDPAPRLAQALGLRELCSEPRPVDVAALTAQGARIDGELWAMALDAKRTLDDAVRQLAPDRPARQEILANPIYRELSSALAGSQEMGAMVKLYELREQRSFDLIVLDTPPSRNAVDFIETPTRLLGFLEGRALKVFLSPGGLAARMFGRSSALIFAIFARVTGVDMFADLSRFFRSLAGVIDAFGARTRAVASLLRDPSTTFLIVTSPEHAPAREARFLARGLGERGMLRGGLIVNRVHHLDGAGQHSPAAVQALLAERLGASLAARAALNLAEFEQLARRERDAITRLSAELEEPDPILVPDLEEDVHDLAGLAQVAGHLFS